jgi:hypothetical protein
VPPDDPHRNELRPDELPSIEDDPEAPLYTSTELEDEDGEPYVIQQQNVGPGNEEGGGEWPDPHTPPRSPAPGAD